MTTSITGDAELMRNLKRLGDAGRREGSRAVRATAEKVRSDAIKSIQRGPATGRVYERSGGQNLSARHQASAPGEAPMTDTGNLAGSGKASHEGLFSDVIFTAPYAIDLEYGTFNMEPRPFLIPALEANRAFYIRQLKVALERAANGVST